MLSLIVLILRQKFNISIYRFCNSIIKISCVFCNSIIKIGNIIILQYSKIKIRKFHNLAIEFRFKEEEVVKQLLQERRNINHLIFLFYILLGHIKIFFNNINKIYYIICNYRFIFKIIY